MGLNATDAEFSRNLGFLSIEEQQKINDSVVAIAGAGGDGGALALQLARVGVGEIRLADPDTFEVENINRQATCTIETVDVNKAEAVADYIGKINPRIKVDTYTAGVTADNVEGFVSGADLLIDETEFTVHSIGVMLARQAREEGIPNLMALNVGFGFHVTTYRPDGATLEDALGLSNTAPIEEIASTPVGLERWLPDLPEYIDIDMLAKVASGDKSAPSVGPGVALAAGAAATQAILSLVRGSNNRPDPVYAPEVLAFDAMTGISKIVPQTVQSHEAAMDKIIRANELGLTPKVSY